MSTDFKKIVPANDLSSGDKKLLFTFFFRRLAQYRNTVVLYAALDLSYTGCDSVEQRQRAVESGINNWGQNLLKKTWIICHDEEQGCPKLDSVADTATRDLDGLAITGNISKLLNTVLFLDITTSKQYSAHTRVFLKSLGQLDEATVVTTLKNPSDTLIEAQKQAEESRFARAEQGKILRTVGMGVGAVVGGILVGVTGGLAAPLVGAGVATVLGWLGVGGSLAGLLASALASSSVVCGALFGIYGAQSTASMIARHTKEVRDLALVPVGERSGYDTLGVRVCVSGWLTNKDDVVAPWRKASKDDTFAIQWEIKALETLADALMTLVKSHAMKYLQREVIKRTIFASLMSSLSPLAWLKIGQIVDNPWMNARALAIKTGTVLGDLLANRAFGKRPVTLAGYSLGALVIFEALKHLATALKPEESMHLIENVFLFGAPVKAELREWQSVRRVVAGRLVNGYAQNDYVLGVLSRLSDTTWEVAGLQGVEVQGVENICCEAVEGHTMWRSMVGKYTADAEESSQDAPGATQKINNPNRT